MTITEKNLADALAEAHADGFAALARKAAELLGVELAPEPPAPGQWFQAVEHGTGLPVWGIQSKNSPRVTLIFEDGTSRTEDGLSVGNLRNITPARVVPVTAAPVMVTEDQVGEEWDKDSVPLVAWSVLGGRNRERITATVNTFLAQHAAPAERSPHESP